MFYFYCCITNYLKTQQLKTTIIYYFSLSRGLIGLSWVVLLLHMLVGVTDTAALSGSSIQGGLTSSRTSLNGVSVIQYSSLEFLKQWLEPRGQSLELTRYHFYHSLLIKASHKASPAQREGKQIPPLDGSDGGVQVQEWEGLLQLGLQTSYHREKKGYTQCLD